MQRIVVSCFLCPMLGQKEAHPQIRQEEVVWNLDLVGSPAVIIDSDYQSKTICENKNVSYEAHLCPVIVKVQRAPNAQATLQIVDRHYEEFLSPAALTLKPLRRPSNRLSPRQHFIRLCSHIVHVVYRRTWYVCCVEKKPITDISPGRTCRIRLNVHRNSISGILFSHIVFVLTYSF
jgi:hypothetical protein